MHKHLEQIIADLEDLCVVFQVRELCLQLLEDDVRANKLLIARPTLCDQFIGDDPRLLRAEEVQDLSIGFILDLSRRARA